MLFHTKKYFSLFIILTLTISIGWFIVKPENPSDSTIDIHGVQSADTGIKFSEIVEIDDDSVAYSRGNVNGLIDAGEKIEMRVSIKNFESFSVNNVVVAINCTNPKVVIEVKQVTIPQISAGLTGITGSAFQFYVKTGITKNTTLIFYMNITATEGQWLHQTFTAKVFEVPIPEFVRYALYSESNFERSANNDKVINAGEGILADIYLRNSGGGSLSGASATLICSDPFIGIVTTANQTYSSLTTSLVGEKSARYTFNVSGSVPDKYNISFTLDMYDAYGTNYRIDLFMIVNGTPKYDVINISISAYEYLNIDQAEPNEEYNNMSIYLKNIGTSIGKLKRIEIACEDSYFDFTGSKKYEPYSTMTLHMQEIFKVRSSSFSFIIKSNTLKGHVFSIQIKIYDERTLQWDIIEYSFTYEPGMTLEDLFSRRSLVILFMLVAIVGSIVLAIPRVQYKMNKPKKVTAFRVIFFYMFLISLIVYLGTEISPYYFIGFLILFYGSICGAGLAKSGVFRNISNPWDDLIERKRETLPRLIATASKQIEAAQQYESKNDFNNARNAWNAALIAYQKIVKKGNKRNAQESEIPFDTQSILKNIDSIRCNLGLSYVHEGILSKTQAKSKIKELNYAIAAKLYEDATKAFTTAKEYFKKEADLAQKFPNDVNVQQIEESEKKYAKKATIYRIQDELEVMKRQVSEITKKIEIKEKLIETKNESNTILKRIQNIKFELEKQDITILDEEIRSFVENLRATQFKIDKKIDEMLGVVNVSKYFEEDEDEEEDEQARFKNKEKQREPLKGKEKWKKSKEPEILREYEFLGGKVRFKVKIANNTKEILTDLKITFSLPESLKWIAHEPEYPRKGDTLMIPKLGIEEQKTISLYLNPINCTGSPINATLTYFDSKDQPHAIPMKPKKIEISCPIFFTKEEVNPARVKHLHQSLPIRDKKILPILEDVDINEQIEIAIRSISLHDVKFVDKEERAPSYEFWYFGTTKVKQKSMTIYLKIDTERLTMLIEVSGENHENITALLAEIEDQIRQEINSINSNYNEESYLDLKTTVLLGHCPYCFNPISKQMVKDYKAGKSIFCNSCNCQIDYYE